MSNRIVSNSTFAVNSNLEQVVDVGNASLAVTNAGLTSLASAISGSEVQVDIVSAPTLNVADSTAQGSLSTIAGAVSGSEMQVDIVSSGTLPVSMTNAANSGTAGNLVNNTSKSSGDFSSEVDTRLARNITISGTTTDSGLARIEIYTAHSSGGTKFKLSFDIYPDSNGNFYEDIHNVALNYIYLKFYNSSPSTITATALFN